MLNRLLMSILLIIGVSFVAWMELNTWLNELLKSVPMSEMIFFAVGPSVFGQGCLARASIALPSRSAVSAVGVEPPWPTLVMVSSTVISSLKSCTSSADAPAGGGLASSAAFLLATVARMVRRDA